MGGRIPYVVDYHDESKGAAHNMVWTLEDIEQRKDWESLTLRTNVMEKLSSKCKNTTADTLHSFGFFA
jgi:hypothetical protein